MTRSSDHTVERQHQPPKRVLVVAHTGREANLNSTRKALEMFSQSRVEAFLLEDEFGDTAAEPLAECVSAEALPEGLDLVLVLGGDGTFLRAAEVSREHYIPLLGVNHGRVGFLAERERDALAETINLVIEGKFRLEERLAVEVTVDFPEGTQQKSWALNEASIEKVQHNKMLELVTEIDGRPITSFGADGIILATPTGSTAYAFSAGGPIVWPDVEALMMIPICAHAVFARPILASPQSQLTVEIRQNRGAAAVMWCDGRRRIDIQGGSRVTAVTSDHPVKVVRLDQGPFTDRLVEKFRLPIEGWQGPRKE